MRILSEDDILAAGSTSPFLSNVANKTDPQTDLKIPSSLSRSANASSSPPIRILNYPSLMDGSRAQVHTEMTQTVENLASWLGILEEGLNSIMSFPRSDVIEEEQEPITTPEISSLNAGQD